MSRFTDIRRTIDEDTEYLPTHQAIEFTRQQQKENMLKYWKDKAVPDCQKCSRWEDRCTCSWKITETEHGPRCFFYTFEFIKEEELHA